MIIFSEMDKLELIVACLNEFTSRSENLCVALHFALVILCAQASITDKEFLLVTDLSKLELFASVGNQNGFIRNAATPILNHSCDSICWLVSQNQVKNGVHGARRTELYHKDSRIA